MKQTCFPLYALCRKFYCVCGYPRQKGYHFQNVIWIAHLSFHSSEQCSPWSFVIKRHRNLIIVLNSIESSFSCSAYKPQIYVSLHKHMACHLTARGYDQNQLSYCVFINIHININRKTQINMNVFVWLDKYLF